MDPKELRDLSVAELKDKHRQFKEELFNLRFQMATNQLDNTARVKSVKHDIARVQTEMRVRQLAAEKTAAEK